MNGGPDDLVFFSGLDADTGEPAFPPLSSSDLTALALERVPPADETQALSDWLSRVQDDRLGVAQEVDPCDLASAGWGVLLPPGLDPAVQEALKPLLDLRRGQAAAREERSFCAEIYRPEESFAAFLSRHGTSASEPAHPAHLPYYILLVGDPREIPFAFQYQLDVQYAVGRLWFETPDDYAAYAQAVVAAETGSPARSLRPRRITLFGPDHPGDKATAPMRKYLLGALAEALPAQVPGWSVEALSAEESTKERLGRLAGGGETPAVLFTACHGMSFPAGDPRQKPRQGALVCQDYSGQGPVLEEQSFAAADVASDARLDGLIAFCFGCHSAGTPSAMDFLRPPWKDRPLAPEDFLSGLPRRLLRSGALAVVGHVERAWGHSFLSPDSGASHFQEALTCLLAGHPAGAAMERFGRRYADLASRLLAEQRQVVRCGKTAEDLTSLWMAAQDARNFLLLGDPAVRVTGL